MSVSDPVHGICRCVDRSGLPAIRSCRYAQFWKILFPELVHAQLAAVGAVVLQCPQLGALDLSGDGFGQLGKLDAPDSLVGRQVGARMRQDRQRPMRRSDCAPVGSTTNALGTATRRASGLGTREHRLAHAAEHYAQAGRVADLAGGFGLSETAGSAQLRLAPRRCAPAAAPRRSGLPGDAPARRSRRPVAPRLAARVESAGVEAINQELHKRPTSTAVRYCLQWQPLGEDEGAPVGLEAARTRLANSSAERERGDADPGRHTSDGGGSLVDPLACARLPPLAPLPCRTPAGMCARILLICTRSVMNPMMRMLPPHKGHTSGNTFFRSMLITIPG